MSINTLLNMRPSGPTVAQIIEIWRPLATEAQLNYDEAKARLDAIPQIFRGSAAECATHAATWTAAKKEYDYCRKRVEEIAAKLEEYISTSASIDNYN